MEGNSITGDHDQLVLVNGDLDGAVEETTVDNSEPIRLISLYVKNRVRSVHRLVGSWMDEVFVSTATCKSK